MGFICNCVLLVNPLYILYVLSTYQRTEFQQDLALYDCTTQNSLLPFTGKYWKATSSLVLFLLILMICSFVEGSGPVQATQIIR